MPTPPGLSELGFQAREIVVAELEAAARPVGTVGAVVSGAGPPPSVSPPPPLPPPLPPVSSWLLTVKLMVELVVWLPLVSVATAVRRWLPLPRVGVSQAQR